MKTQYRKWISKKLKHLRENSPWTQTEIANKIDLKTPTYQAYEEGRSEPSLMIVQKLCTVYKISVDKFLEDSPMLY